MYYKSLLYTLLKTFKILLDYGVNYQSQQHLGCFDNSQTEWEVYWVYIDYSSMVYLKEKKCQKLIVMYNMQPFFKDWNILEKSVYYKWWIHVRYFIYAFAVWNALLVVFMGINSLQTWNQNVCCVNRFMVPSWFTMCTWSWHIIMTWFSSTHYMLVYWYCPNQG